MVTGNIASNLENRLPPDLLKLLRTASALAQGHGLGLYVVGGAVRDLFLNESSIDLDLVVEGDAIVLAKSLAESAGGWVVAYQQFGTANFCHGSLSLDFATARSETYSSPGALPTVSPSTIDEDLGRRDFTINAMAISFNADSFGRFVDPYGGENDLSQGLIRILHENSFTDDATRIFRAIRYEQRLGFRLEPETEKLLRRDVAMLDTISNDRLRHELELIFEEQFLQGMLLRADELGVLTSIHWALKGDKWLANKLQEACSSGQDYRLVCFLLITYRLSDAEAEELVERLNIPGTFVKIMRDVCHIKNNLHELSADELARSDIAKLLEGYSKESIRVCDLVSDSSVVKQRLQLYLNDLCHVKTSLDGHALRDMGITQGAHLGKILIMLRKARLDHMASTVEEERSLVHRWLAESKRK